MTHVLAVRQDNQGDVLLAGPAVRALAAGADRVTLMCGPRGEAAARLLPGVDEVICHRADWIDPEPSPISRDRELNLVDRIAGLAPDQAVIFTSFHQSPLPTALLLRLAGVREVAATSDDYPGSLLDHRHRIPDDVHEVERALSLVGTLGYDLPPGDDGRLRIRRDSGGAPSLPERPYVVVHPGASVPARAWAPRHHRDLVGLLRAGGWEVVVTGGPRETELTAAVAAGAEGVRDLGGRTDLGGLGTVIAGAAAIVVGNTGPAHIAAAVGTPVVSIYAPTVPAVRWRPWRVPHEVIHVDVPCAGCRARVCPIDGHPCIDSVDPATVARAVARVCCAPAERLDALSGELEEACA